ncbi:ABC transporter permease [Pararobbsia silviterrae]|uniref:ABC transporter permease n=2 Tax=Pararobbsia silviterrae TaxID=1792498 RepID=A0A494XGI3_9BURK|nr:ABC transporter permease [Pararobbsia silviterrae]
MMRRIWRTSYGGRFALVVIVGVTLVACLAPRLAPYDPYAQQFAVRLMPPSSTHWLGTDGLGRDVLSRLMYGARPTLGLAVLVIALTVPIGLAIGIVAGYAGGWIERVLMRVTDIFMAFPRLVLALAFVGLLGPGLLNGALALVLTGWPAYARVSRAEIAALRRSDYLAAAEMQGITGFRLFWGHLLPICVPSARVRLALDLASIILAAAGLGFLGLGVRPPAAEWGTMVADGSKVIFDQWWLAAIPGLSIVVLSLAFNLLADALRDSTDPHHER